MVEESLSSLFNEWWEINKQIAHDLENFDFKELKESRSKQRKIEDIIYKIVQKNAPENLNIELPDDCSQMEVGFDFNNSIFYFIMEDPDYEDDLKLIAIKINKEKEISIEKDFNFE
ncbi:MAG: hypothetical protein ACTSUX_13810 [Promethearchaeota archaeon]